MKTMRVVMPFLITLFLQVSAAAQVRSQGGGEAVISGTVKDAAGKPVPFANVFIPSTGEGQVANEDGSFSFATSATGRVELICSAVGLNRYVGNLSVVEGRRYEIAIVLSDKPIVAQNVDVTASSFSGEPGKGLAVTQMDVYTTPGGAADIFQSIKTLPGLTQVSESSELYVRGGDPQETLVLLDQATLYNPYTYESPFGGLFSNVNTAAIGSMFFSSGGFSVKYGNALSGVLDLKTKGIPPSRSVQFGLSMAGGSVGIEIPALNDRLGVRVYARKNFTGPIFWLNGGNDRFSSLPSSQDAEASVMYKYSPVGSLKLFLLASSDDEGVNVDRPEVSAVFSEKSRNFTVNLQHTMVIGDHFLAETSLSGNSYSDTWLLGLLDLDNTEKAWKVRSDMQYSAEGGAQLSFGGEISHRTENYTGTIPMYSYDIQTSAASKVLDATFSVTRYGAYFQAEKVGFSFDQGLFASAGSRGDYVSGIGVWWLDPRMTIGHLLSRVSTLRFSAGVFHEYPNPRFYSPTDGNPHLLPMRAVHYVLGYDYKLWKGAEFRVEAYEKDYTDLPDSNAVTNLDNSGRGFARGVDVILKGDFPFGLGGWISYGYIHTKRKWYKSDGMAPSPYDITHELTIIAKYNVTEAWQVGVDFKYATGMPYTPIVSSIYVPEMKVYEPIYGPSFSQRYPDYRRLDIRLTRIARLFHRYLTVFYVEGLNILNIHNIFSYTYSRDYSQKTGVESFFGRRMVVVGIRIMAE